MSKLATRAEIVKLADTLGLTPGALEFFAAYDAEQIRHLREAVYDLLFRQDEKLLLRMTRLIRWLPGWLIALLGGHVFGPLLAARAGTHLPARKGAVVVARLAPAFAASATAESDPRRLRDVVAQLPPDVVVAIMRELFRRGQYVTVGRFADSLSDKANRALQEASSEEELLRVCFFMESRNRLDHYVRMLPDERVRQMILLAQDEQKNLGAEVLALLVHVSHRLKPRLGNLVAEQSESLLNALVRCAQREGLWSDLLPVVAAMSPANRRKLVNLPVLRDLAVLQAIGQAADEAHLWSLVLPLIGLMGESLRAAVALDMARRPPEALRPVVEAALIEEYWEPLLDVVRRMPPEQQRGFAAIVRELGEVDPALLARIARRAQDHGFTVDLLAAA